MSLLKPVPVAVIILCSFTEPGFCQTTGYHRDDTGYAFLVNYRESGPEQGVGISAAVIGSTYLTLGVAADYINLNPKSNDEIYNLAVSPFVELTAKPLDALGVSGYLGYVKNTYTDLDAQSFLFEATVFRLLGDRKFFVVPQIGYSRAIDHREFKNGYVMRLMFGIGRINGALAMAPEVAFFGRTKVVRINFGWLAKSN